MRKGSRLRQSGKDLEPEAAAARMLDQVGERGAVDVQRLSHAQRGVRQAHVGRHQGVVDDLGALSRAGCPQVYQLSCETAQDGRGLGEVFGGTTAHHRQGACCGCAAAATDRCIDKANEVAGAPQRKVFAGCEQDRRLDRKQRAGPHGRDQFLAECEYACVIDDADADMIRLGGQLGHRGACPSALLDERSEGFRASCPDQQGEACGEHALRHRAALLTKADEAGNGNLLSHSRQALQQTCATFH